MVMLPEKYSSDFRVEISSFNSWPNFSDLHSHKQYELYFLLQGSTYFLIENSTVEICQGDIVWIPPDILHITRPRDTERHKKIGLYVSRAFMEGCLLNNPDMAKFVSQYHILRPTENSRGCFRRLLNMVLEEYLNQQPYAYHAIMGLLTATLTHMRRIYDSLHHDTKNVIPQSKVPMELNILTTFINANFRNDITLSTLSEQVHISPVYISSIFKKHLGFTFKEYLLDLRIKAAMEMLKSTTDSVERIAYACGFNSANHFCKTFKKAVGMPPKMYRNTSSEKM